MRLFDESAPARTGASARSTAARLSLGASPAVLAAMLALQPQVAQAQAFQGTETVILGNVTRGTSGNTDFFTVNAAQNTLNWTPTDTAIGGGPIDFLPAGATASFASGIGLPYTVLNRIIAADQTRAIAFSGTVSSDALGSIWFYAPGGLLLNAGSQFNVGGLLLTANDPVGAAAGLPFLNAANQFQLQAASGSTAGVTIANGATISTSSYMIAVAPRFTMNGAATVGTSAALVAAEDASFTLNGGLFDITANIGTAAGGTSEVRGSITGPGGIGGQGVYSRIYMMAVPRNNAMTLLISGGAQLGFDVANAADVVGNAVVLSGGYDIVGTPAGQGVTQFGLTPVAGSNAAVTLSIDNADFTSNLTLRSKDVAQVQSATGSSSFAANLEVLADGQAIVRGQAGNTITVAGSLVANASTQSVGGTGGTNRTAGFAEVSVSGGGSVEVSVDTFVTATGIGDNAFSPGLAGGTGQGGTAFVSVAGGSLRTGSLYLDASGFGGFAADGVGGSALGGTALLQLDPGGTLTLAGDLGISAQAFAEQGSTGRQSGNATANLAQFRFNSGTLIVPGTVSLNADAGYGEQGGSDHAGGGTATGGRAFLDLFAGANLTTFSVDISAVARGGLGVGNDAFVGGNAQLTVADVGGTTSLNAVGGLTIDASALASNGTAGGNVAGGSATGGLAQLAATGSPLLTLGGAEVAVLAEAIGGAGDGGVGGNAIGGNANLSLDNGGTLSISGDLRVSGAALGGSGTVGGNATAFDQGNGARPAALVRLGPDNGPNTLGIDILGDLILDGSAVGGIGSTGAGGAGRGGLVVLQGTAATFVTDSNARFFATATGGLGTTGGAANAGRVNIILTDSDLGVDGQLLMAVDAVGGSALSGGGGRGGDAISGQAFLTLISAEGGPGSSVTANNEVRITAEALGGAGGSNASGTGGAGGDAFGIDPNATQGNIVIAVRPARSSLTTGLITVTNRVVAGTGGDGGGTGNGGNGGNGFGGFVNIGVLSGPVTPLVNQSLLTVSGAVAIDGTVTGGDGGAAGASGLGGRGGNVEGGLYSVLGRSGIVSIGGGIPIDGQVFAGNAGFGSDDLGGGNAVGGEASVFATPHFTSGLQVDFSVVGDVFLRADANAGNSQLNPGTVTAGSARLELRQHEAPGAAVVPFVGSLDVQGDVFLLASARGGRAFSFAGEGGNATGGTTSLIVQQGIGAISGQVGMFSAADGGSGGEGRPTGDGIGGTITLRADGGQLGIGGNLELLGDGFYGQARGGTVNVSSVGPAGALIVDGGIVSITANGLSGDAFERGPSQDAQGGTVNLDVGAGSALRLRGPGLDDGLVISADGLARNVDELATSSGTGGTVTINLAGILDLLGGASGMRISADGEGGAGGALLPAGNGLGGTVSITTAAFSTLRMDSEGSAFEIRANGLGGTSGIAAGSGSGGTVAIAAAGQLDVIGAVALAATGTGGIGGTGAIGQAGGTGGAATGGSVSILSLPDAVLNFPNLTVDVSAQAGAGGQGGFGGNGLAAANPLPPQRDGNPGGNGGNGGAGGAGGEALGGNITIGTDAANSGGSITITSWSLNGRARAGAGGEGGNGGTGANGGNGLDGDAVFLNGGNGGAGGNGGNGGTAGVGGNATGGNLLIGALSNDQGTAWSLNVPLITANLQVSAGTSGSGGFRGAPGAGGAGGAAGFNPGPPPANGQPGQNGANGFFGADGGFALSGFAKGAIVQLLLYGADLTAPSIDLSADAFGADSVVGGLAGDGEGGTIELVISGGTNTLGEILLSAAGAGGSSEEGLAGNGTGGSVTFRLLDGADVTLGAVDTPLGLSAGGSGGDGLFADGGQFPGIGGSGYGGSIITQVNNARLQVNGDLVMVAEGSVGGAADSAFAEGGTLDLRFEDGSSFEVTGGLGLSARASGQVATGKLVSITGVGNGTLTVNGDIEIDASVSMFSGFAGAPSKAGDVLITTEDGNSVTARGALTVNVSASSASAVFNAAMTGGTVTVNHRGTTTIAGTLTLNADATFSQGAGGEANGGSVLIESLAGTLESNGLSLSASADGGFVSGGAVPTAFGGSIVLRNEAGGAHYSRSGNIAMTANAIGISNSAGPGGDGAAGTISVAAGGTLELDMGGSGTFVAEVIGTGGSSSNGDIGGNGTGGGIDFDVGSGGTLNIINPGTPLIELKATGIGGNSLTQGGTGGGGAIFVVATEASMTLPALTLNVRGEGGQGLPSGNATGGRADVVARESLISIGGDLVLDGNAVVAGSSVEGNGAGGLLGVDVAGTGTLDVAGNLQILALGDGRQSIGGAVSIAVRGTLAVLGGTLIDVRGLGTVSDALATMDGGTVSIDVGGTSLFDAGSSFLADVSAFPLLAVPGAPARAGDFTLTSAGAITTTGTFTVNAFANFTLGGGFGGLAEGGLASLLLTGGSFDSNGLSLQAGATGGNALSGAGGDAIGGNASLVVSGGAVATINGNFDAISPGIGGNGDAGGIGTAGSSILRVDGAGSRLDVANITLGTQGTGGNGNSLNGGAGQGGTALLELLNGALVAPTGTLALRASGFGGAGLAGGAATGGSAGIVARSGAQLLGAALLDQLTAGAQGGAGSSADGGAALGGAALIRSESGGSLALGRVRVASAGSTGGNGDGAGNGGAAISGTVEISADGGDIAIANLQDIFTSANGGNALGTGNGGEGRGGTVSVLASNAGQISILATGGTTAIGLGSSGVGGNAVSGQGGDGSGGVVRVSANLGSQVTLDAQASSTPRINMRSRGIGGQGASGGTGTGGQVLAGTTGDAQLSLLGLVELIGEASGGTATQGSGGDALSGQVNLVMDQAVATSSITTGDLIITAGATAGNGAGILGRGGTADRANFNGVFIGSNNNRGTMTTGNITATMTATGGRGGDGLTNDGGDGGGASAADFAMGFRANVAGGPDAGTISTGIVTVDLNAFGGDGGAGSTADGAGGNGGFGTAGSAFITAVGGTLSIAPASTTQPGILINGNGRGGAGGLALIGGNGGTGRGGSVNMGSVANPQAGDQLGRFESGRQQITMDGLGGAGVIGGDGIANFLELRAQEGAAQVNGRIDWSAKTIGGDSAGGIGGLAEGGGFNLLGTISIAGSVVLEGGARGGNGSTGGGEARGGSIGLRGSLDLQSGFEGFVTADGGNATAQGNGGLARGGLVQMETANAEAMVFAGFAEIFADTRGGSGASGGDATGATVRLTSQLGSSIDLGGVDIRGNANGGAGGALAPQGPARSGNASDGTIAISSGGTIRVRSDLVIQQSRTAGQWLNFIGDGGAATGGTLQISATADPNLGGGILTVDGVLSVVANAAGGDVTPLQPGAGGAATGTNLTLSATADAVVDLVGGAALTLNTRGGSSFGGAGGAGTGARFVTTVNASTVNIGGAGLNVVIDSRGGTGVGGGTAQGAVFDLFVDSGALAIAGDTLIRAESGGGFGVLGGSGGSAVGADIRLQLTGPDNNSRLQLSSAGIVEINTITRGGRGGDSSAGGAGGAATGGSIELGGIGSTGTVAMGDLQTSVFAEGGTGGDGSVTGGAGGSAQGGFLFVGMAGNTQGPAGNFTMVSADIDASARSGNGGAGPTLGANGDATAGSVGLSVRGANGSVAGNVDLFANATSLATARGGVVELSSEGNGVAGDFAIAGNVVAETSTTGATTQAGVVRVFALDGSRLAMGALATSANGDLPSASPLRGGLVADVGSTIAIAGNGQIVSRQSIGLNNGGTITVGGELFVSSGAQVRSAFGVPTAGATGTIAAQVLQVAATAGIDLVTGTTGSGDVFMSSAAGEVRVTDIDANRDVTLNGVAGTSFTSVRGDRNVGVFSDVAINGGTASAGGRLTVSSDGGITVGALDAGIVDPAAGVTPDIYVRALGPITTGTVRSGGDVGLLAQGALSSGAVTSGRDLVLLAGGTITTGALATPTTGRIRIDDFAQRSLITFPGGVPDYTALFAAAPAVRAGDTIINGNLTTGLFEARSTGLLRVTGTINAAIGARLGVGSLQIGSTATQGFLDLSAVDSLVLADLAAQGQISLATDGSITAGNITTGQSLVLAANRPGATLTTGTVRADGEIRLSSNTTLTVNGTLSSGNRIFLTAGGAILSGAIDAGTVNPQAGASGVLFATSPATIRTGPINVSGSATLSGVLGVTTGNVTAPGGIVLLDTGGINAGNLTTSPSGFVYIAAHDLLPQITFDQAGNPQFAALLASTPIRLVGDINLGDASTGRFIAAATGNFFVNNATAATSMLVDVGGTATLDFNINTPNLTVTSSDIVLDPLAAVGAAGGSILFNTTGATTAIIGGASAAAVPGTYRLSNGEFGALRASSITVRSSAGGMTVDQLALPAIAPGQAANPGVTLRTNGTMRVTGAVTMAQAGADNRLNLIANDRIEVVQGSGSVRLGAGVDTPAGTLSITAPRIWVASESLLTELAGTTLIGQARIDAVNAAGAPEVAGGSIGAGSILIGADQEVLIQNSGTDRLKAGFTTGTGGLRIRRAFEGNSPMDVVINGRIQRADNSFATNSDTLALVQLDPGISLVTAGSTVNGCIIVTAQCPGLLPEEIAQPVVTIVNNIEELTPEQEEQREAAQAAAEKLPIVLLQRLIDFSPLFVDPDATDPVTSGGNPALWMDPMPRGVRAPGGLK